MADNIFKQVTQVQGISDEKPVRLTIPRFTDGRLWIRSISGGIKPNFQLMYSVGSSAYLNVFGQRMALWPMTGIHIPDTCLGDTNAGEPSFLKLYRNYNLETAEETLDMAFSDISLSGFFVEMSIQEYNKDGVDGFQFKLVFLARMNNLVNEASPIIVEPGTTETESQGGNPLRTGVPTFIGGSGETDIEASIGAGNLES